jgi:outer membrane protein OmpA-like peptidoglycan-associated protein
MRGKVLLYTTCLALSMAAVLAPSREARAQEIGSLYYYDADSSPFSPNYHQWRVFLEYQLHREPCQHYQEPPPGYVVEGCRIVRVKPPVTALPEPSPPPVVAPVISPPAPAAPVFIPQQPVTIYFDFDKSNIRENERAHLSRLINEVRANNPSQIIISGHTDTAGPYDYNMRLSRQRAQVVADALVANGVPRETLAQRAYGETDLAVPTGDNMPLQANRRTVIIFVR